jgi:hypothetical protein
MTAAMMAITLRKRTRLGIAIVFRSGPWSVFAALLCRRPDVPPGIKGVQANTLPGDDRRVLFWTTGPPIGGGTRD